MLLTIPLCVARANHSNPRLPQLVRDALWLAVNAHQRGESRYAVQDCLRRASLRLGCLPKAPALLPAADQVHPNDGVWA